MKYLFEEHSIVDGAHWIDIIPDADPDDADCPFYQNAMDVVNISSFEISADLKSIVVNSPGGGYLIPIAKIASVKNVGEDIIPDPVALQVYDFFAIAKGYIV